MIQPTHVRLCTNPDWCCLEGGCGYCDHGTFKTVRWLRQYAARNGLTKHFNYGYESGWPNRDKRLA
jgi:hypothetical protein